MLLRLLGLFVFIAAPVILAATPARAAAEKVEYTGDARPGTIVIQSGERRLYLVTGKGQALKYPVGVGRSGQQWYGTARIAEQTHQAGVEAAGIAAGQSLAGLLYQVRLAAKSMGAAALVLVDNELAIHGTNNPGDRRPGVRGLYPHAQQRHRRYVRPRRRRHAGGVCEVISLRELRRPVLASLKQVEDRPAPVSRASGRSASRKRRFSCLRATGPAG